MKMQLIRVVSFAVLLVSACGSSSQSEAGLTHYSQAMTQSLDGLETTASAHHRQVLGQSSFSNVRDLEQSYTDDMNTCMDGMRTAQQSIARCANPQTAMMHDSAWHSMQDANTALGGAVDDAAAEVQRHRRAMQEATDLHGALVEERAHQTALDQIIERMRIRDDDMMGSMHVMEARGDTMMCMMMSHTH